MFILFSFFLKHFGQMKITRGTEHEFLGIKMSRNIDSNFRIGARLCLETVIEECGNAECCAVTPSRSDLFKAIIPRNNWNRTQIFSHKIVHFLIHCPLLCLFFQEDPWFAMNAITENYDD